MDGRQISCILTAGSMRKINNMSIDNIGWVTKNELCCGCGTCAAVCREDAIEMVIDHKRGIYTAFIDNNKCNLCGVCVNVCPGYAVDFGLLNQSFFGAPSMDKQIGFYQEICLAHAADHEIRYTSSSGGIVTAMLLHALEMGIIDGALVTAMCEDTPLVPRSIIARTPQEIKMASKSKYCPVAANVAIKEIINSRPGKKFAVVGLPCHMHGLRKAELIDSALRERIVFHLGLFCEYTPAFLATEFLLLHNSIVPGNVQNIEYRGGGWPGPIMIKTKDGHQITRSYQDTWSIWKRGFFPKRCLVCFDKANELSDISFADPWGITNDSIGSSLLVVRNKAAGNILMDMVKRGRIHIDGPLDRLSINSGQGNFSKKSFSEAMIRLRKFNKEYAPVYRGIDREKPSIKDVFKAWRLEAMTSVLRQRRLWPFISFSIPIAMRILKFSRIMRKAVSG